jgi:hypothetical protein
MRLEAARTAAPYCHPRLSAVDVSNSDSGPAIVEIVKFSRDKLGERQIGPHSVVDPLNFMIARPPRWHRCAEAAFVTRQAVADSAG